MPRPLIMALSWHWTPPSHLIHPTSNFQHLSTSILIFRVSRPCTCLYQWAGRMSSSQESKKKSPPQSQLAVFTFVSDETQHGARSHAMRQHWKLRRQRLITEKEKHEDSLLRPRPILPHASDMSDGAASDQLPSAGSGSDSTSRESKKAIESEPRHGSSPSWTGDSIPSQALSGMNVALGSCKLDPFDKFPVKFTHRHHHLLHHC